MSKYLSLQIDHISFPILFLTTCSNSQRFLLELNPTSHNAWCFHKLIVCFFSRHELGTGVYYFKELTFPKTIVQLNILILKPYNFRIFKIFNQEVRVVVGCAWSNSYASLVLCKLPGWCIHKSIYARKAWTDSLVLSVFIVKKPASTSKSSGLF